jgi:hypothetical protein
MSAATVVGTLRAIHVPLRDARSRGSGDGEVLVEHRRDRRRIDKSDDAIDCLTAFEKDQTRDTRDLILSRKARSFVRIKLDEADAVAHLNGHFLNDRCKHLARAAPGGPEIN